MATYYGYTGPESPAEYLENNIFPILLPALEEMLRTASITERRKLFDPLDYLTTYLYKYNPKHTGRENVTLGDIPFVKEEWITNPRPPLPLSATLTKDEAATIIQAFFRGYLVRREGAGELFRTWQRKFYEERIAVRKIQRYWRKKSGVGINPFPNELTQRKSVHISLNQPMPNWTNIVDSARCPRPIHRRSSVPPLITSITSNKNINSKATTNQAQEELNGIKEKKLATAQSEGTDQAIEGQKDLRDRSRSPKGKKKKPTTAK